MAITTQQREILTFIKERLRVDGYPPSQLEICDRFAFTQNAAAAYHLRALEAAGEISRTPGAARGIRLRKKTPRTSETLTLPILGRVAAGLPIGAATDNEDEREVDRSFFSPIPDYLLRVLGDSMIDDGIWDGDLVAVRRSTNARSGQIVVARIDDEITIKRLKIRARDIQLLPCNPAFEPIVVRKDTDFAIEGIFCGLVRCGQ